MNTNKQESNQKNIQAGGKTIGLQKLISMGYRVPEFIEIHHLEILDSADTNVKIQDFLKKYEKFAVRSSANVEDSSTISFAGQFLSFLGVLPEEIYNRIIDVRQSANSEHVLSYIKNLNLESNSINMNVILQEFNEPLIAGVWMGDNISGGRLEWAYGRGDQVVNGTVTPYFEKYEDGQLVDFNYEKILTSDGQNPIAHDCLEIQRKLGYDVDIEFCITDTGVHWLQLRNVTRKVINLGISDLDTSSNDSKIILGEAASPYVASGDAYRLDQHFGENWGFNKILVARATSPNDMMFIITSNGVITKMGGMLSHAAVVCRELGKACVVGVDIEKIPHSSNITVDGTLGVIEINS